MLWAKEAILQQYILNICIGYEWYRCTFIHIYCMYHINVYHI